ncbi:MAG: hypothetical protein NTY12_03535 [Candidatus Falkowbacteria bacterium]|nr:hypothetical protein [Candidatus Falkowbacteria bacterium]
MSNKKIITLCSSAAFFKQGFEIGEELVKLGFKVKYPYTAMKMKDNGDFRVETYKTWFKDAKNYKKKTWLIKNHFKKVIESDAILVLNYPKNGLAGYIGGNTLAEMVIAFHYKKPIYILNPISENLGFKEEVYGLESIFLNGDLKKISLK